MRIYLLLCMRFFVKSENPFFWSKLIKNGMYLLLVRIGLDM
jgi:hypothetical protein